jgi:hypothetical protein
MPYKPKRAGKSTREMAKKRRRSAAWTALIGVAGVVVIILLLKYSKAAGISGIGVLVNGKTLEKIFYPGVKQHILAAG